MSVKQLSVFVENKEGAMSRISDVLASEEIDIRALSIADTTDFGILRLVVHDTEKAVAALRSHNIVVSVAEVLAVVIPDKSGSLAKVLRILADDNVNVEYMYSFLTVSRRQAHIVLKVEDVEKSSALLVSKGIKILSDEDLDN